MAAELRNGIEVGLLCRWRQIADHHVVDHAPAQRADLSHRKLLSDEVVQQPNPVRQETPASAVPYCEAVSFNPQNAAGSVNFADLEMSYLDAIRDTCVSRGDRDLLNRGRAGPQLFVI